MPRRPGLSANVTPLFKSSIRRCAGLLSGGSGTFRKDPGRWRVGRCRSDAEVHGLDRASFPV